MLDEVVRLVQDLYDLASLCFEIGFERDNLTLRRSHLEPLRLLHRHRPVVVVAVPLKVLVHVPTSTALLIITRFEYC
jgi:hypothetical protein